MGKLAEIERKKTAEAADIRHHAGRHGFGNVFFHQLDGTVAGGDVDACRGVAF